MGSNPTPEAHEDLYLEIMRDDDNDTTSFVLETEGDHPDIEFEVGSVGKPKQQKLRRAMPDGLFDGIELPDDVEEADDISSEDIDLSDVSISDMTFSEKGTEVWLDTIAENFDHDYYSESEIYDIFNKLGDEYFISAGSFLIEISSGSGPVVGFRREN